MFVNDLITYFTQHRTATFSNQEDDFTRVEVQTIEDEPQKKEQTMRDSQEFRIIAQISNINK